MKNNISIILVILTIMLMSCSNNKVKPCKNIDRNPMELTFGVSYCNGDMCIITCDKNGENCHTVKTKEECERIDVIKRYNINQWGQDYIPDCEWINNNCVPNK